MRKIIRMICVVALLAALVIAAVALIPRLTHTCDNCEKFFLGSGYSANAVSDMITHISGQDDKILCEDCAMREHALEIAAGKTLDDFKNPLFYQED